MICGFIAEHRARSVRASSIPQCNVSGVDQTLLWITASYPHVGRARHTGRSARRRFCNFTAVLVALKSEEDSFEQVRCSECLLSAHFEGSRRIRGNDGRCQFSTATTRAVTALQMYPKLACNSSL